MRYNKTEYEKKGIFYHEIDERAHSRMRDPYVPGSSLVDVPDRLLCQGQDGHADRQAKADRKYV